MLHSTLHLHLSHLADALIQSDLQIGAFTLWHNFVILAVFIGHVNMTDLANIPCLVMLLAAPGWIWMHMDVHYISQMSGKCQYSLSCCPAPNFPKGNSDKRHVVFIKILEYSHEILSPIGWNRSYRHPKDSDKCASPVSLWLCLHFMVHQQPQTSKLPAKQACKNCTLPSYSSGGWACSSSLSL
jgi:hypothetical protein